MIKIYTHFKYLDLSRSFAPLKNLFIVIGMILQDKQYTARLGFRV